MTYLLPIENNYSNTSFDVSKAFFDDFRSSDLIKKWIPFKMENCNKVSNITANIAIAAITCIAIACLPKTIALGCIAVSAVAYARFARMVEAKSNILRETIRNQRIISCLTSPSQIEEVTRRLRDLKYENTYNLNQIENRLKDEDLEDSFKTNLLERQKELSTEKEELDKKENTLQANVSIFEPVEFLSQNGFVLRQRLLPTAAKIFLSIDQYTVNRVTACRDFMFHSLTGAILIKSAFFVSKVLDKSRVEDTIAITVLVSAGAIAVTRAVKNMPKAIAHREAKIEEVLAWVTDPKTVEHVKAELYLIEHGPSKFVDYLKDKKTSPCHNQKIVARIS